jgi:hypothetical protein
MKLRIVSENVPGVLYGDLGEHVVTLSTALLALLAHGATPPAWPASIACRCTALLLAIDAVASCGVAVHQALSRLRDSNVK